MSQQKQGPLARYEYARLDANPQSGELGPTNDLLQRESRVTRCRTMSSRSCCVVAALSSTLCLVLGEYTPR